MIGTFFNGSWSAAPAASAHDASSTKSGRRGTLQVSLTVSAGGVMGADASNVLPYPKAEGELPRAPRIWPEAGAGLGPGLVSNPAARHPMRPIRTGGLFGRLREPGGRGAAAALPPGVAGLRPLSPRSPGQACTSPAWEPPGAALLTRGLCRACAASEPAMAGSVDAEGILENVLPAVAITTLGVRLVAAAARARGLAGVLAGALGSTLRVRIWLLAAIRALSGFVAWPLWAAASAYAPLGCQRSLAAPCSGSGPFGKTLEEAVDGNPAQHARRGMLWMHRLPMYRGRLLGILGLKSGLGAAAVHSTSIGHPCASLPGKAMAREANPLPVRHGPCMVPQHCLMVQPLRPQPCAWLRKAPCALATCGRAPPRARMARQCAPPCVRARVRACCSPACPLRCRAQAGVRTCTACWWPEFYNSWSSAQELSLSAALQRVGWLPQCAWRAQV